MYGLKQAGVLANKKLEKLLNKDDYFKTTHTPGLWTHCTRPITFTLCVDDFGVKYVGQQHAEHLIKTLKKHYEAVTVDWKGKKFCGIDLEWDYNKRTCDISMKDYISKALTKFNHFCPKKLYHSPSLYTPPKYGQKIQIADLNSTTSLSPVKIKEIQKVVGSFLFYGRVCDYTMLHALNALATAQSKGTKKTKEAMLHFLNY